MTIETRIEESTYQFPVGMRVLAVDDDPTCLRLLEQLLKRCKYLVTTRTNAIDALNLLRENKNRFDLVISDVHMPDMDGFKLLELVGLEMDLPVIMLSGNGDPKLVMKGVTHGACDYLLKPVRIEELQIIWQHVVRKKKVHPLDQNASENHQNGSNELGAGNGNNDHKANKKRKDQVEDEDEYNDDDALENDDPSAPKKPRVVWSFELHRKFVAAVNYLGVDKAVSKKILELMNVEKLTKENVASHLQKYRLYLRRISCVQSQQANMVAAFRNTDHASYSRINLLNGLGGFNHLSGSPLFQNAGFRSFQYNDMLGRLNSTANLDIQHLPSTRQVNHSQFSGFSGQIAADGGTLLPGNSHGHVLRGMPMSFESNQLQDNSNRTASQIRKMPSKVDNLTVLDTKPIIGSYNFNSSNAGASNNPLMLQGHPVQANITSSQFAERVQGKSNWPVSAQSSAVHDLSNSYASYSGIKDISSHFNEGSSNGDLPLSITDYQYQSANDIGTCGKQQWDNVYAAPNGSSNLMPDPLNSSNIQFPASTPYEQAIRQNAQGIGQLGYVDYPITQHTEVGNMVTTIPSDNLSPEYQIHDSQQHAYPNNVGSLEDLVSFVMK